MHYRREIDGLRAVAVLPVILFHAGFPWFSGGFVGVDVFFVISGYLITTILLKELSEGEFSIVKFYERRARRILPALFFVVLCCIPFAWAWLLTQDLKNFSQALVAISLFSSNALFWIKSGYFEPEADENPLLHTWSLAVEEQFYIFFPILLLSLWRFGNRRLLNIIIILSCLSLVLAEYGWRNYPSANFFLLPARAWELGVGAICAFLLFDRSLKGNSILSILGLGMIGVSIIFFDEKTPFPSIFTLVPVVGTAFIIMFGHNNFVANFLSKRVLVGIGLISFSAYLWHQPLFAFTRIRSATEPGWLTIIVLCFASLLLAALTWKFVEQPFRAKKSRFSKSRRDIFVFSSVGIIIFTSLGTYGHFNKGFPNRSTPSDRTFAEIDRSKWTDQNYGLSSDCEGKFATLSTCRTGSRPRIAVWGDSYAMHIVQAILASRNENENVIQFTQSECAPLEGISIKTPWVTEGWAMDCISFNKSVLEWIKKHDTIEYVVMSSPMTIIHHDTIDFKGERSPPSKENVALAANNVANVLVQHGKKPVFISPPPQTGNDLSKCATHKFIFGGDNIDDCSFNEENFSVSYVDIMKFLKSDAFTVPVIDLKKLICANGTCRTLVDNVNIYRDKGHLSYAGSYYIGKKYDLLASIKARADSYWREENYVQK